MTIDDMERDLSKILHGIRLKLFEDPKILSDTLRHAIRHGGDSPSVEVPREMLRRIIWPTQAAKCAFWDILEPAAIGRALDRFPLGSVRKALDVADHLDGGGS